MQFRIKVQNTKTGKATSVYNIVWLKKLTVLFRSNIVFDEFNVSTIQNHTGSIDFKAQKCHEKANSQMSYYNGYQTVSLLWS